MSYNDQPAVTELTSEELQTYLALQKKVGWQRTGTEVFESFFGILPMVPFECAVVRYIDGEPCVLLWHRDDEHYTGWHMPGKYLLRGETDEEGVRRVLKNEADLELTSFEFIRHFNTRPESGDVPQHQQALFWLCRAEGEPTVGRFFPLTKLPEDILGHHRRYVDHLRAYLMRDERLKSDHFFRDHDFKAHEGKWFVAVDRFAGESKEWYVDSSEYDTLDAAIEKYKSNREYSSIFDDLGHQIC
ncbi:MAG: hypothetical protein COU90_02095 [Candidatus Ryanbacteria bacterium CG10_big_fil_rev_8_21_14_0_10_43_42]|uniref:Nudix hydrolase domain-containing protein n=1 Tax=Candidatus Ryanbacteria bacterium CG10_big_fil_rev_8_21_14_0_10_43_42 TaxID=1974864 RepID=A0A2M8KXF8_9BACT|nr:MAG: hypothetical protein COU90_02095 [Candidatus Ryanbacteria bacterium CG10_big_fil_rev_8_21_14_0_10_43_42]